MSLINELLGFVVLTGPLFFIVVWLLVCIWIAEKLAKRFQRKRVKRAIGFGIFILSFLVLFADGIAGHFYLNYLCATEAGVKVYQSVVLSAEHWDNGKARFMKPNGDLDHKYLGNRFSERSFNKRYSNLLAIDERHHQVVDEKSQEILGEVISFMHWGGWIHRNFGPPSAISCQDFHGNEFWRSFYSSLFVRIPVVNN